MGDNPKIYRNNKMAIVASFSDGPCSFRLFHCSATRQNSNFEPTLEQQVEKKTKN